jgi:hypothetical protein
MENDRMWTTLYHGWIELLTLFALLLVALVIMGWSYNRGLRPADRGPVVGWFPLIVSFGTVLLLRQVQDDLLLSAIIALAVLIGGFISRVVHPTALWIPLMILSAFLGLGLNLTALVFTLLTTLVLLLSARPNR